MGKDPSDIRAEIEETRERVGDEVDALSYKTDVGARMSDYVDEKKQAVKSTVTGAAGSVGSAVTSVVPDTEQVRRSVVSVRQTAERNPLGLAVGSVAVGFVIGTLLPSTRMEDEKLGDASDRVVDAARETGREALERGKDVAQETAQTAAETAKQTGRQQGEELASSLQERAQDQSVEQAAPTSSSSATGGSSS
jgi:hypothetical protein